MHSAMRFKTGITQRMYSRQDFCKGKLNFTKNYKPTSYHFLRLYIKTKIAFVIMGITKKNTPDLAYILLLLNGLKQRKLRHSNTHKKCVIRHVDKSKP